MKLKEFTGLMAVLMSCVAISIDALLPGLGMIASEFELVNRNSAQYVVGAIFIGLALGQLIWGPLSDAVGRKPILYTGFGIFFLGTLVCYFSTSMSMLLFGRFIQGIGVAGPNNSAVAIVRDNFSGREMAKIMSLVMMIFVMVPGLAPSLGEAILFISDWRGIFIMYLLYALCILIWVFIRLDESLPETKRIPLTKKRFVSGFGEVLSNKAVMRLTLSIGLVFGSLIAYVSTAQQIYQDLFNTGKMFSIYFGVVAIVLGAGSLLNSQLVEKYGMFYISSRAFKIIVSVSIPFVVLQLFIQVPLWLFVVYIAIVFFNFGLIFGNLNSMAMEPMGHIAGIASAVIASTTCLMSVSIGTLIGQLYNGTVLPISLGIACLALCALLLLNSANERIEEQALQIQA